MGRFLFLLFLLVPLIEIAFFVVIGGAIGLWPTLAGVLIMAVAGSLILRWQGLSIINEIRSSVGHGQLPARALADAMMIGLAGILLLTPGYFTDLLGLLLLIPPVRSAIYAYLRSRVKVVATATGASGFTSGPRRVEDGTIDLDSDEWRPR
ncbi:FxsA family protein [Devosia sp. ZB163]|uniref:FxsA family protein n=1 Tax=Devosia sp. ZB163 TaxID=3025938 RepID=UPI00235E2988|nr:FxsA family protein [Devosia sp. ZB163]MDC9822432.1 FxsA family protein [Devosia sp. ZB163]